MIMGKNTILKYVNHFSKSVFMGIFLLLCTNSSVYTNTKTIATSEKTVVEKPQNTTPAQQQDETKILNEAVKLFIKEVDIYGTIPKPQVVIIVPGTNPKVDGQKLIAIFTTIFFLRCGKNRS